MKCKKHEVKAGDVKVRKNIGSRSCSILVLFLGPIRMDRLGRHKTLTAIAFLILVSNEIFIALEVIAAFPKPESNLFG
jgi:hypothetical protein